MEGYSGYTRLTPRPGSAAASLVLAHCWAHARRKLKGVHDRDGSPIAAEGLQRIAAFYRIESEIRGRGSAAGRASGAHGAADGEFRAVAGQESRRRYRASPPRREARLYRLTTATSGDHCPLTSGSRDRRSAALGLWQADLSESGWRPLSPSAARASRIR